MATESVKVVVRCRPFVEKEKKLGCKKIIDTEKKITQVSITKPDDQDVIKSFRFDEVFDDNSTQQQVYDEVAFSLVESVIEGYNGTIFAYGQTGCGKTHTMIGNLDDENLRGIMPQTFTHVFSAIQSENNKGKQFLIRCSFIEIYNEEIRDLLNHEAKKKLEIKENQDQGGVYIKDCLIKVAHNSSDLEKALKEGNKNKSMGETQMNRDSSRSHCVFTIYLETSEMLPVIIILFTNLFLQNGQQKIKVGKLNLVDLAGSEKQKKTGATGVRLKEATKINLSLSALMNVITCLVDGKSSHIPYRDSKLTRLLQDSLGGNTKTCMIANISPADYNYDETLSTLRYADRAKQIKNKPKVNQDPKDALLREYAEEIQKLKEQLAQMSQPPLTINSHTPVIATSKLSQNSNPMTQSQTFQTHLNSQQLDNYRTLNQQKSLLHNSMSQSPAMNSLLKLKAGHEYQSSGGSFLSHPKQTSQPSQMCDEEFILSNSEFMTDEDARSRGMSKSPMNQLGKISSQNHLIDQNEINKQIQSANNLANGISDPEHQLQIQEDLRAKMELESKLKELQEQLQIGGNQILEAKQEKMNQYREFQIRLKQQKQREKELLDIKIKQEEEMMLVEKNYQTLQEEVEDMRKLVKKFRKKYRQAVNEIKDLNTEHNSERAELFQTIQDFDKENSLYKELMRTLVSDRELQKLLNKCEYDQDNKKWDIPLFVIKEKSVGLPKMPANIKSDKQKKEFQKSQIHENQQKNQVLLLDSQQYTSSGFQLLQKQQTRNLSQNEDVGRRNSSLSQTNYDKWRDFSKGKKQLEDFADAPSLKQVGIEINNQSNQEAQFNLSNQNKMINRQQTLGGNSLTQPASRDSSIENLAIVQNKKPKKKILLKPLIPPTTTSHTVDNRSLKQLNENSLNLTQESLSIKPHTPLDQSNSFHLNSQGNGIKSTGFKSLHSITPTTLTNQFNTLNSNTQQHSTPIHHTSAAGLGQNATQQNNIDGVSKTTSKVKITGKIQPINLNVTKKLDPIAKKNLINQLKAHLQKDQSISNVSNTDNSSTNYNIKKINQIMNFNFFKTSPAQDDLPQPTADFQNSNQSEQGLNSSTTQSANQNQVKTGLINKNIIKNKYSFQRDSLKSDQSKISDFVQDFESQDKNENNSQQSKKQSDLQLNIQTTLDIEEF